MNEKDFKSLTREQKLEEMAKARDLQGILAKNEAFIKYAEELVKGIKAWLEKNDKAS